MTAPYQADAETLVRQSLEHRQVLTVVPAAGEPFTLEPEDLELGFSEDWAPHVELTVTAPVPDAALVDALDPRAGCRLLVSAGYVYPDRREDVHQLADVALYSRQVSRPANTMRLSGVSGEAQLQDYRTFWDPHIPATGIAEAMDWILRFGLQPKKPKVRNTLGARYGAAWLEGIEAPIGTAYWDVAEDAAQRVGAWVYCDGTDTWQITKKPELAGAPAHRLTVGQDGTLIRTDSALDRSAWANAVVITYEWTDAANNRRTVHGRAQTTSGPFAVGAVGFKTHQERRQVPVTQAQANQAAAGMLRNLVSRGRSLTLDAVAAYWLRPGMTVAVTLPTGATEHHLVMSVRFRPGQGTMTLTTRQPLNVTITTGE